MKTLLSCFVLVSSFSTLYLDAQNSINLKDYLSISGEIGEYISNNREGNPTLHESALSNPIYHIPVAVHFINGFTAEDTCCLIKASLSQIEVLNNDFNGLNPDIEMYEAIAAACPQNFPISSLSKETHFHFYLANSNHPTQGNTCVSKYAITVNITAGTPAVWDGYLNIFVDGFNSGGILGQTIVGSVGPGRGVLIKSTVFGGPGVTCFSGKEINTETPYIYGRTCTHEVGHLFNLLHPWSNTNSNCTGDGDEVADTPKQNEKNLGAPKFNFSTCTSNAVNSCGNQDFYMNFMEDTDDNSKCMFTVGQMNRMLEYLESLQTSYPIFPKSGTNDYHDCTIYPQPGVSTQTVIVTCPSTTYNINSVLFNTLPEDCGTEVVWSTVYSTTGVVLSTVDPVLFFSGTFYAYYYSPYMNCFSQPSLPVTVTFDLGEKPDEIITSNTLLSNNSFGGNLIVESDATLQIVQGNIFFRQGKGIIVKERGNLILNNSTIDVCDKNFTWSGVKLESGASLITNGSYLLNTSLGIEAKNGSSVQIDDLSIEGKGYEDGNGLILDGNINVVGINNIKVENIHTGILVKNSSSFYELNGGEIKNTSDGIYCVGSPLMINGFDISFSERAINLINAPLSYIYRTNIIFKNSGIWALSSPNVTIDECWISNFSFINNYEFINENPAISLVLSDGCRIINNPQIKSSSKGITSWGSNKTVIDGNFDIRSSFSQNNSQLPGGPINLIYGNYNVISNNNITGDNSEFGVNTSLNGGTLIENNTISGLGYFKNYRVAAIKSTGNLDEQINQNIVNGENRTGILVQNTSGNQYFCNDISALTDEALEILYNSEQQRLKANYFTGGLYDLKIKSEIGIQATFDNQGIITMNNGNEFQGGNTKAEELSQIQINNSRFPVNPVFSFHMPTNPVPSSNWFTSNVVTTFESCEGLVIGNNFIFNGDPNEICSYWNYLKSFKDTKPEQFFVKLAHLLKYSKIKPGFILPNCIKLDSVFQSLCGLTKIVDVSIAISKIGENSINYSSIDTLYSQYIEENSLLGKQIIKDQIAIEVSNIMPLVDSENSLDSIRIDSLKNELYVINCSSIIVNKWKDILNIYLNFLKDGRVSDNDKNLVEQHSTECSDIYGDVIHLARAIANSYNKIYYDVYDGCLLDIESKKAPISKKYDLKLSPNPSNGVCSLDFSAQVTGTIFISDINGKILEYLTIDSTKSIYLNLSNRPDGIYFIKILTDTGLIENIKFILLK